MYAIVAGGGKVGANVARSLLRLGHEVTLVEQRRDQYERLEDEFEHQVQRGDATELFVLERAGIARPPRITEIRREPSGSESPSTRLPAEGESPSISTSTISRFSRRSSSRWIR